MGYRILKLKMKYGYGVIKKMAYLKKQDIKFHCGNSFEMSICRQKCKIEKRIHENYKHEMWQK